VWQPHATHTCQVETVAKMYMTYKLYTSENRKRQVIPVEEYYNQLDENQYKTSTERDNMKKQLLQNAIKAKCYNETDNTIDIMKYAIFYCMKDWKGLITICVKYSTVTNVSTPGIHDYLFIIHSVRRHKKIDAHGRLSGQRLYDKRSPGDNSFGRIPENSHSSGS
jgi:hypothetical protein